ncbi:hypothetical protein RVR_4121 [Actinacidiphila reveromycinica]|uniref:Uncharacterized protein n=1 Tax=Actinacidiphila reveromycinica TaxID=659352 RepID=A0A7U3UT03_9ACTN|nr:type II toxin-antitoxin system VapB family antitoxin [Streptomyces sp. SN-593]BBA98073.1 hypothetical protein RVR_4121 [Streptomyces sp. SN-593]
MPSPGNHKGVDGVPDRPAREGPEHGTKTKAKAVRLAMEDAVKRHLRQEFFDAMDAGELDFSEIVETTGPRDADGSLKRHNGQNGDPAA